MIGTEIILIIAECTELLFIKDIYLATIIQKGIMHLLSRKYNLLIIYSEFSIFKIL